MAFPAAPEPLPSPVTDTHCHLDIVESSTGLAPAEAVIRAAAVGVDRIVQIGCDVPSSRWAVAAAGQHPGVVAGVALHPNEAARLDGDLEGALAEIAALAAEPGVRVVGETGLDHYRTPDVAGRARQVDAFRAHIALAKAHDRTLVIHDRDAHQPVLDVLDAEDPPDRIVMHCFSGDPAFARACLDRGAYLSFAGTVTFRNNVAVQEALRVAPLDRILTETDAPFLTPVPHRGKPNAPFLVPHTVRFLAHHRGVSLPEMCRALAGNAEAAFGGPWGS